MLRMTFSFCKQFIFIVTSSFKFNTMKIFKLIFILLISAHGYSQFGFEYNDSIIVKRNGDTLIHPWVGGLNHAQFSEIDYNFDGYMDLFVFDRSSFQIRIFLNEEASDGSRYYKYLHNTRASFPEDVRYRAMMIDYNGDGKNDLWTYGIGGIKVYRNIGNVTDGLQWELATNLIRTDYLGFNSNLYVSSIDIPAYVDVDGDGDIDVLTYHIGGQRIEYHKNLSMETYGHADSLIFELKNECWGQFSEGQFSNTITLNSTVGPCGGGSSITDPEKTLRHSGSTILALDLTDNGVMDLVLGDVEASNLTMLINGGTAPNQNSSMVSYDPNFPSNTTPVDLEVFPASFYLDIDHDGVKDLVVSSNASGGSENLNGIWFYKNLGTNTLPNFSYVKNDLFQGEMIENGKGSIPLLVDVNNDGLKDIILASTFRYKSPLDKVSKIQYFQNTGTATQPEFTFVSDDWLGLSSEGFGLRMAPTFGDLNDNGLPDMILGASNGAVHYFEKTGNGANDYTLTQTNMLDVEGNPISVQNDAAPELFDLDNDGLLDLIIGQRFGGIHYYKNVGTETNPAFELITNQLGAVDVGTQQNPQGYAIPRFVRSNDTTHLFVGARSGTIFYYQDIDDNLADGDEFELFSDNYAGIKTGTLSAPFITQIRGNDSFDLFVGGDLGGLWNYTADPASEPSDVSVNELGLTDFQWTVYPNPSETGEFKVKVEGNDSYKMEITDLLGRKVYTKASFWNNTIVDLKNQKNGVYLMRLVSKDNRTIAVKRVIIK